MINAFFLIVAIHVKGLFGCNYLIPEFLKGILTAIDNF